MRSHWTEWTECHMLGTVHRAPCVSHILTMQSCCFPWFADGDAKVRRFSLVHRRSERLEKRVSMKGSRVVGERHTSHNQGP